jgi:hypothetical protein
MQVTDIRLYAWHVQQDVEGAIEGADIVWHTAALVGPYFPKDTYKSVNVDGTQNIVDACRKFNVKKLVASSSPSTRFDGNDIAGKREDELPIMEPGKFLQEYAETKAQGEMIVREACGEDLLTVVVAPHQVRVATAGSVVYLVVVIYASVCCLCCCFCICCHSCCCACMYVVDKVIQLYACILPPTLL